MGLGHGQDASGNSVKRRRYVMDLAAHLAECEANFARLMRLLPNLRASDRGAFKLSLRGRAPAVRFEVASRHRYTTVLRVAQDAPLGWDGFAPGIDGLRFAIRICHDARCAEVIECQRQRGFEPVYDYPNAHMRHRDEKAQVNRFLGEFLAACLRHGVSAEQRVPAHEA